MSVRPIPVEHLEAIFAPRHDETPLSPHRSLLASATLYDAIGEDFSAAFCRKMALDCAEMGAVGDALYGTWAREQADRAALRYAEHQGDKG